MSLSLVCGGALAETPPVSTAIEVELRDGLLRLNASGVPLADVVREIGDEAGFETLLYGELERPVAHSMIDVPLELALRELLRDVSHSIWFDRTRAPARVWLYGASAATDTAAKAEPPVITHAVDSATAARIAAMRDETARGDLAALEELARLLREDSDPAVRSRAAAALGESGDPAVVPALRIGATDTEQIVRLRAIRALAAVRDDRSTRVLADALSGHPDTRTRLLAAWALRRHDTPLARTYLEAAESDDNTLVRQAVAPPRHEEVGKRPTRAPDGKPPAGAEASGDGTRGLPDADAATR